MILLVVVAIFAFIFLQTSRKLVAQPAARPITATDPKK